MRALLGALGKLAREEQSAMAALAPQAVVDLSSSEKDKVASRILKMLTAESAAATAPRLGATDSSSRLPRRNEVNELADRRQQRRSRPWALTIGGIAAAAAALVIGFNLPSENDEHDPLPVYGISASGGLKDVRGGGSPEDESAIANVQRLTPETELHVVCRPQTSTAGAVGARTFFVKDGLATEIHPRVRTAPSGAVEISARGSEISGAMETGHGSLRIVVGRPERLREIDPRLVSDAATDAPALATKAKDRWLTVPLEFEPR
jgi:hypothetical protein